MLLERFQVEVGMNVTFVDDSGTVWDGEIFSFDFDKRPNTVQVKIDKPNYKCIADLVPLDSIVGIPADTVKYIETFSFPLLDKIRIDYTDEIVEAIGIFEPIGGNDGVISVVLDEDRDGYYDLKMTTDGKLAVILSGYYGDINELVALIPVVNGISPLHYEKKMEVDK